nr:retrovirus-related Pol polyprotein from transposon TNT 1-94 [Tanacetum cinerariifolium]
LNGRSPRLDFMRPFGCPVTILNTLDPLGKFEGKTDEGFLVGYSVTSKAFRVFNAKTRNVEENLHVRFLENKPSLQDTNGNAGTQDNVNEGNEVSDQHYIVLLLWSCISSTYKSLDDKLADDKPKDDTGSKTVEEPINKEDQAYRDELNRLMSQEKEASDAVDALRKEFEQGCMDQREVTQAGSTNNFNNVSNPINTASTSGIFSAGGPSSPHPDAFIPANTLLHMEPKKVSQALDDESWVEAMQKELLQFSLQKSLCDEFKALMHERFQMSPKRELTFFLGLQVKQGEEGIFISQDKYVAEILKKFDFSSVKITSTPIETQKPLVKDEVPGKVTPLYDSMLVQNQAPKGEGSAIPTEPQPTPSTSQPNISATQTTPLQTITHLTVSHELQTVAHIKQILPSPSTYQRKHKKTHKPKKAKKVTELPQTSVPLDIGADEAVHQDEGNSVERGHTVGSREDKMEQETNLTDFVPLTPHDSSLSGGHTPGSDEGRPNLLKLMNICTKLSNRVLALEEAKTPQDKMITRLKLRVRRLERKRKARTSQPMKIRLFKDRVETSTDKSLEDKGSGEKGGSTTDQVSTARLEVSAATPSTHPTTTTIFGDEDLTITQTLIKMRSEKAKEKGVAFRDVKEPPRLTRSTTTLQPLPTIDLKDKGRISRVRQSIKGKTKAKKPTIAALTEEFDEIQARMVVDHEFAVRMTHEEEEAIRNKPPTRTQVRNKMITYLKHMGKYTHQQLKDKTLEELQMLYEREKKWIDNFVPIDSKKEDKKSVVPESKDKKGKRIKRVADSAPK